MASTVMIKKFDFHEGFWLLHWNITSHRSEQPVIGNVQDKLWIVDSRASSCKERSGGNEMENILVLVLCTPSGF